MEIFVFPAVFRRFLLQKSGVSLKAQVSFHWLGCCAVGWGVVNQGGQVGPVVLAGTRPGATAT